MSINKVAKMFCTQNLNPFQSSGSYNVHAYFDDADEEAAYVSSLQSFCENDNIKLHCLDFNCGSYFNAKHTTDCTVDELIYKYLEHSDEDYCHHGFELLCILLTYGLDHKKDIINRELRELMPYTMSAESALQLTEIISKSVKRWAESDDRDLQSMASNYLQTSEFIANKSTSEPRYGLINGLSLLMESITNNIRTRTTTIWLLKHEKECEYHTPMVTELLQLFRRKNRMAGVSFITIDTAKIDKCTAFRYKCGVLTGTFSGRWTPFINREIDTVYNEAYQANKFRIPFVDKVDIEADEVIGLWVNNVFIPSLMRSKNKWPSFKMNRADDVPKPIKYGLTINDLLVNPTFKAAVERRLSLVPDNFDYKKILLEIISEYQKIKVD
ncbi:hypothetical protein [Moritella sp. F3]|uniref:hypothetical protein n=1 Tax=Moritella sp. F3 TaxID=2718882 RepID=UPI0018E1D5B4|nr:hypothetical protein [Moritella sp. F3]GIC77052.1 hypothetical protein FMO001_17790 [Moritella sp. F1]GIC82171.1 hypothetical protein FMO003_24520 [Moritella sp. F3]